MHNLHVFPFGCVGLMLAACLVGPRTAASAETLAAASSLSVAQPIEQDILGSLRPSHPRLLLLPEDLARVNHHRKTNPEAVRYYSALQEQGRRILKETPIKRILIGPRLLDKSRTAVERLYTLGLLYQIDSDAAWARRAWKELEAAAAFKDWNPAHFLDVAEMTHAFAIGYDWFYHAFSPAERSLVRQALVDKGLRPAEMIYRKGGWWTTSQYNWNNVCNGGILSGSLAVADEEPVLAAYLISKAVESLPLALASYAPDGAWAEGPGYWGYATRYTVLALACLQSALGQDFGLSRLPGMAEAGYFRIYGVGPTGLFFNFADAGDRSGNEPSLFWLSRRYDHPALAVAARLAAAQRTSAQDLLFFNPEGGAGDLNRLPLDKHFRKSDIVFLKSSWSNPQSIYVAFKAGDNKANHSNLDLGSFVLDAAGERWAIELGADDYNLPAYFGNKRWTYYRMRTEGQNTLLLNQQNQDPKAAASVLAFASNPDRGYGILDLTAGYAPAGAQKVHRGIALLNQRRQVLIQDEIAARAPVEIVWTMHTRANVKADGAKALLELNSKSLHAQILSPGEACFEVQEVNLAPPQRSSKGLRKLLVRLPAPVSRAQLAVLLTPGETMPEESSVPVVPLEQWAK